MWTKTIATPLFVCLINAFAVAQSAYTVTDLGPLAPTAINSWAQVVGNHNNKAYIWNYGHRRALGMLHGGTSSSAAGINDFGVVAGTADGRGIVTSRSGSPPETQECSDLIQPFVWTPKTGMRGLGTIGDPTYFSIWCDLPFDTSGINDAGEVVGFLAGSYNETQWGFRWKRADGMSWFGGSWVPTFADAVSNNGEVVGQNSIDQESFVGHATSWKKGVVKDLGTLGGGPDVLDYSSSANAINNRGEIVGWSTTGPVSLAGSPVHAVLWNQSSEINDLGTLPGDTSSTALKVNCFGLVIGLSGSALYVFPFEQSTPFEITGRPFIWSKSTGMLDLNSLIPADSNWVLDSVSDINVWGQIVGSGTHNGKVRGFLLTPTTL